MGLLDKLIKPLANEVEIVTVPKDCIIFVGKFAYNKKGLYLPACKGIKGFKVASFKSEEHANTFLQIMFKEHPMTGVVRIKGMTSTYKFILNMLYNSSSTDEILAKFSTTSEANSLSRDLSKEFKNLVYERTQLINQLPQEKKPNYFAEIATINTIYNDYDSDQVVISSETEFNSANLVTQVLAKGQSNSGWGSIGRIITVDTETQGLQNYLLASELTNLTLKKEGYQRKIPVETKKTSLKTYTKNIETFLRELNSVAPSPLMKQVTEIWNKYVVFSYASSSIVLLSAENYSFTMSKLKPIPRLIGQQGLDGDQFMMTYFCMFLQPMLNKQRSQDVTLVEYYQSFTESFISQRGGIKMIDSTTTAGRAFYSRMKRIIMNYK